MEWAFAALVGVIAFVLGYAVRSMKGGGSDSLPIHAPTRMAAGRTTTAASTTSTQGQPAQGAAEPPPLLPSDALAEVEELLLRDKKIEAIKAYREATGAGLKESKAAVEAIQRKLLNPANSA